MAERAHWYRIGIDVDAGGNPIGASYEVHLDDVTTKIHVLTPPAPFDTVEETFDRCWADLVGRYGLVLQLLNVL